MLSICCVTECFLACDSVYCTSVVKIGMFIVHWYLQNCAVYSLMMAPWR